MRRAFVCFTSLVFSSVVSSGLHADALATLVTPHRVQCHRNAHTPPADISREPGRPAKPRCEKPGDRDRTECPPKRYQVPNLERAGSPQSVAKWAKCSVDNKYSGSYTGGGAAIRGHARKSNEGTWGLDYHGIFRPGVFSMGWTSGRKQGGEGKYETDGEPEVHLRERTRRPQH